MTLKEKVAKFKFSVFVSTERHGSLSRHYAWRSLGSFYGAVTAIQQCRRAKGEEEEATEVTVDLTQLFLVIALLVFFGTTAASAAVDTVAVWFWPRFC